MTRNVHAENEEDGSGARHREDRHRHHQDHPTEARREEFFAVLTALPEVRFAVASVDAGMIDQINILQATHRAMNDALA